LPVHLLLIYHNYKTINVCVRARAHVYISLLALDCFSLTSQLHFIFTSFILCYSFNVLKLKFK